MYSAPAEIRIVEAREPSLAQINGLIARSKAHWNWPEGYLQKALPLHTISLAYLRSNHCFEILDRNEQLIGFFSLVVIDAGAVLDNLWVTPARIGQGIGQRACEQAFRLARQHGWAALRVLPDPPSEAFYIRMGFSDTGERVPSRITGGPMFCVYRIQLSAG